MPDRAKILLVDDREENLIALEAILSSLDIIPVRARSGEEALKALLNTDFALILLECVLIALRVGGAITWDWGWVLAPVLAPSFVATMGIVVTGIALGALDERDAARRRSS